MLLHTVIIFCLQINKFTSTVSMVRQLEIKNVPRIFWFLYFHFTSYYKSHTAQESKMGCLGLHFSEGYIIFLVSDEYIHPHKITYCYGFPPHLEEKKSLRYLVNHYNCV